MSLFPTRVTKTGRRPLARPEQILQVGIFADLIPRMVKQKLEKKIQFIAYHIPNGGFRTAFEGKKLKEMGVRAVVADILMHFPDDGLHPPYIIPKTVYIELKAFKPQKRNPEHRPAPEDILEDTQADFRADCIALGIEYHLVAATDIPDALRQIHKIMRDNGVDV